MAATFPFALVTFAGSDLPSRPTSPPPPPPPPFRCPGCSHEAGNREAARPDGTFDCQGCGGLITYRDIYLGDSYLHVLPYFVEVEPPAGETRYFDLMCVGSAGRQRRHGWFDPATRRIVQVG